MFVKAYAQHYNVVNIGVRDGLLHSLVTGVAQDKRGNIWMSTGGGLCKYNGVEFLNYTTRDGLNFTRLTCVATDDNNNVWVGSSRGLNLVVGNTILSVDEFRLNNEIIAIAPAEESLVWVISNTGLFKVQFTDNKFHVEKIDLPSFKSPGVTQIFQDRVLSSFVFQSKNGSVYFGNNGELYSIVNKNITPLHTDSIIVNAGVELFDGTLLFGTNRGLYKLVGNVFIPFDIPLREVDVRSLCSSDESIWVLGKVLLGGVNENFLYSIELTDFKRIKRIGKSNGLLHEPTQIFVDHEKNLWTISNTGVSLLKASAFTTYNITDGLVGNKVWGLYQSKDSILWVGTIGEGMSVIKNNIIYNYNSKNGLPDNYVGRIYQARNGNVYIGTSNAGLNRAIYSGNLSDIKFHRLPLFKDERLRIDDVLEDNDGVFWIATNQGLFFTEDMRRFYHQPLFQKDTGQVFIQKLLINPRDNALWVGTRYNGIFIIQDNKVEQLRGFSRMEEISSLALDSSGFIWIGTRNRGAIRFDGENFLQLDESDGLTSNLVYVLYPDSRNNLWVGTNLGLDKVDLTSLKQDGFPQVRHYGSEDGLVDLETNLNGVIPDGDDGFWISTNGGLLRYSSVDDRLNSIAPKIQILSLKLNSQDTDWTYFSPTVDKWNGLPQELKLKYNQNYLTFEFVGISFKNPKMVKYAWKLDGFDDKWIVSSSRQAIYSNIPPGDYVFKVKAANSDMIWSEELHSMPFTVHPPFWATWWFRILCVLLIALGIYLYFINRIKTLRDKQRELESLVGVRTFELREQFSIVEEKNRQILDSLKYAKFLQSAMLKSVDDIRANFTDAFVFYRPKDFVSGDFYWYSRYNDISVLAVADCTGHGVPGAIISVICENALRQAVIANLYSDPARILQNTNRHVIETFSQTHKDIHDGMEIALCVFNHQTSELTFSGAKLGVYIALDNDFFKLKPSIKRIGWNLSAMTFDNQVVKLDKGSMIFMFTDGYGDQFDYKSKEKFSSVRLRNLLFESSNLNSTQIHSILEKEFESWKGDGDQIDDVLVVGVRI